MSRPRAPLLVLVLALAAVTLAVPGAAVGSVGSAAVDTPTLTATEPLDTPTFTTVTATATATDPVGTETVDDTTDAVNDSVDDTTEAVDDTTDQVGNAGAGTTDTVNETIGTVEDATDDPTSTLQDAADSIAGETMTATALSVDAVLDAGTTDGRPLPTTPPSADSATEGETAPASADETSTPAPGLAVLPGARGDLPVDGPADPLAGAAVLGGAVAVTGLASRTLLTGRSSVLRAGRSVRLWAGGRLADLGDRLDPILGPFGYQRYDDTSPLDHDGRRRLAEAVREVPGVHLSAVSDDAGLPLSTARYHLRVLEHEGLVRSVKLHGKRRFFPPDVEAEALASALADDATARVLRSLVREGPASVSEVAERLDRDPSTVSYHLDRLADGGLVERERAGRAVVSSATAAVERAVERLRTDGSVADARPVATD